MTQSNTQQQSPRTEAANVVNGVDLEVLGGTVGAIQADPELGTSHFRVSNTWIDGARNESRVTGFYGAAQEIAHRQAFTLIADEPPILAGNDDGANPVEHLLHADRDGRPRGRARDSHRGDGERTRGRYRPERLSRAEPENGERFHRHPREISCRDGDIDAIRELAEYSPVFNTLTRGVNVDVQVERK
jgi:hypothetical protein